MNSGWSEVAGPSVIPQSSISLPGNRFNISLLVSFTIGEPPQIHTFIEVK
jgi:hypothetical protein